MSKSTTRSLKHRYILLVFAAFVFGCTSFMPIDETTEKPITDMKDIVGKWEGVIRISVPWLIPPTLFSTIVLLEDGSILAQTSYNWGEYGPYLYKKWGYLHNGKLNTRGGSQCTLYERDGKRVLIFRSPPWAETQYEYIDNSTNLPSKKIFLKDYNY